MQENLIQSLDIILNKWATIVQISIVLVLVLVFVALWRNFARKVVLSWMLAWTFNLIGLLSINLLLIGVDYFSEKSYRAIYLFYALCKIWFAIMIVNGLGYYLNQKVLLANKSLNLLVFTVVFMLALFFLKVSPFAIQIMVYVIVGTIFATSGIYQLITRSKHKSFGLPILFCVEASAFFFYAWALYPSVFGAEVPSYLRQSSFFDSIIELSLGISCLFAIFYQVIEEYQRRNDEMEIAQQSLRELLDNDPLTGLWNRRKLDDFLQQKFRNGTLIYIDVNDFKVINDTWGHAIGDLCLQRIASSLRKVLTNQAGLFRLGGDEFLAVIPNISDNQLHLSILQLKNSLSKASKSTPSIKISVGTQAIGEEINFNQALKMADLKMYEEKKQFA
jgi:diguanylate cyclase (GGDEF)-like protein